MERAELRFPSAGVSDTRFATSQSHQTAPLGLSFFAGAVRAGDPTKVAAAAVLVAAPILVVYLFLQRHFVRGMLAGAIKE